MLPTPQPESDSGSSRCHLLGDTSCSSLGRDLEAHRQSKLLRDNTQFLSSVMAVGCELVGSVTRSGTDSWKSLVVNSS